MIKIAKKRAAKAATKRAIRGAKAKSRKSPKRARRAKPPSFFPNEACAEVAKDRAFGTGAEITNVLMAALQPSSMLPREAPETRAAIVGVFSGAASALNALVQFLRLDGEEVTAIISCSVMLAPLFLLAAEHAAIFIEGNSGVLPVAAPPGVN